jgi:flagellar biosynthesis GTPase FlhF
MHPERFRAATVGEAPATVERAVGAEALVISTRVVSARGWTCPTGRRVVATAVALPAGLSKSRPPAPGRGESSAADAAAMAGFDSAVVNRLVAARVERVLALEVAAAISRRARRGLWGTALREALRDPYTAVAGCPGVRTHRAVAAGSASRDAARVIARDDAVRSDRVVRTRRTESDSIPPLMRVPHQCWIPVPSLGMHRVPEDLTPATAALLVATMLEDPSAVSEDHS